MTVTPNRKARKWEKIWVRASLPAQTITAGYQNKNGKRGCGNPTKLTQTARPLESSVFITGNLLKHLRYTVCVHQKH